MYEPSYNAAALDTGEPFGVISQLIIACVSGMDEEVIPATTLPLSSPYSDARYQPRRSIEIPSEPRRRTTSLPERRRSSASSCNVPDRRRSVETQEGRRRQSQVSFQRNTQVIDPPPAPVEYHHYEEIESPSEGCFQWCLQWCLPCNCCEQEEAEIVYRMEPSGHRPFNQRRAEKYTGPPTTPVRGVPVNDRIPLPPFYVIPQNHTPPSGYRFTHYLLIPIEPCQRGRYLTRRHGPMCLIHVSTDYSRPKRPPRRPRPTERRIQSSESSF